MSGLARMAKKHWKRKVKAFKKYWKVVAIAVAAYFTFGLAMGAMAPAAGTVAAGTGAATTGAGVMTATGAAATGTAAAATGAATAAGIETVTVTAAATGGGISAAGAAGAIGAGAGAAAAGAGGGGGSASPTQQQYTPAKPVQPQQPTTPAVQSTAPPQNPSLLSKAKTGWKEMSFSDKLLLAKAGVDVVAASTAPSPEEEAAAAAKWQGAFYGRDAKQAEQFVNQQTQAAPQPAATAPGKREIVPPTPSSNPGAMPSLTGTGAASAQRMQFESTAQPQQQPVQQTPQQVTNQGGNRDLFAQRAPGVRYLV